VLEQGHAVVLGWWEQVFTVVSELVAANVNQRSAAVEVLADRDKTVREESLGTKVGSFGRTRLICRSGPTTDPAMLPLTSPVTAGVVLVLPSDEPNADAEVVKTLLALRAALAGTEPRPPVVAAVRDDQYRLAACLAAGPDGVLLESDTVTARLIVQAARRPRISLVHQEPLDFAGDEFCLISEPALTGRPFGDVLLSYSATSVIGLMRGGISLPRAARSMASAMARYPVGLGWMLSPVCRSSLMLPVPSGSRARAKSTTVSYSPLVLIH
jgi:hypothetical protein